MVATPTSTRLPRRRTGLTVVAGHLCLDLTPQLFDKRLPAEGGLLLSGDLAISSGGAVPNVGLALVRLGQPVSLVGNMGDDPVSALLRNAVSAAGEQPALRSVAGAPTSYSIVIAQGGMDRLFLHCSGANETFTSDAVSDDVLDSAHWLHFGYPPLMPAMCANDGEELERLFSRACQRGLRTSLDFCSIDTSTRGEVRWDRVLSKCAANVTVFAPGLEEISVALDLPYDPDACWQSLSEVSSHLLSFGFSIVVLKLGSNGLYIRSTENAARIASWKLGPEWIGRELFTSCFDATLINANGAGDCTIAGLITAIIQSFTPEQTLMIAAAVGASSVEASDASSGVMDLEATIERMETGWAVKPVDPLGALWQYDESLQLWKGPYEGRLQDRKIFQGDAT